LAAREKSQAKSNTQSGAADALIDEDASNTKHEKSKKKKREKEREEEEERE